MMQDLFANHPMINMYKKAFENPMSFWTQNMEAMKNSNMTNGFDMKNFNPMSFMQQMMPWNNQGDSAAAPAFNFQNMGGNFKDMQSLSLENTQAVMRRQAEIIQKHAEELYKLMQSAISSSDPKEAMNRQSDYMRSTFNALVCDFKELTEMYSKANMESFDAASSKFSEHLNRASCSGFQAKYDEKVAEKKAAAKK